MIVGTMQLHYEHGVPKGRSRETLITDTASATTNGERLAIVFRRGLVKEQNIDTGTPCTSLEPRVVLPLNFGRVANLEEGRAYSRNKLLALDGTRYVK